MSYVLIALQMKYNNEVLTKSKTYFWKTLRLRKEYFYDAYKLKLTVNIMSSWNFYENFYRRRNSARDLIMYKLSTGRIRGGKHRGDLTMRTEPNHI